MEDEPGFRRLAGIAAILSAPLAFGNILLGMAAVNFAASTTYNDPSTMLTLGAHSASLYRWSMICDVFGYYLLLAPLMTYLASGLKPEKPLLVKFYERCGLGYILIGAIAAVVMAAVLPPLITAYGQASLQTRETLRWIFDSFYRAGFEGLFNPLEMILGGVWWLGIGLFLRRKSPALGVFTILLGVFAWLDAFGTIVQVEPIFMAGLAGTLLLMPAWALWCGIALLLQTI